MPAFKEVQFRLLQLKVEDGTWLEKIGKEDKRYTWVITVQGKFYEIVATHNKAVLSSVRHTVTVSGPVDKREDLDGAGAAPETVYPKDHSRQGKLTSDFEYPIIFSDKLKSLNVPRFYEFRRARAGPELWYLGTLKKELPLADGDEFPTFEASVLMPNSDGLLQEVQKKGVAMRDIREAKTKAPLQVQKRAIWLKLSHEDPMRCLQLSLDQKEDLTKQFIASSPANPKDTDKITITVDKHRHNCSCDRGHYYFKRFMSNDCFKFMDDKPPKETWRTAYWSFRVGPKTTHKVLVHRERVANNDHLIQVFVDEKEIFSGSEIDAAPQNEESVPGLFTINFMLVGKTELLFKVFPTNSEGVVVAGKEQQTKPQPRPYELKCRIEASSAHIDGALLFINDKEWNNLQPVDMTDDGKEPEWHTTLLELQHQYQLNVPFHVDERASTGVFMWAEWVQSKFSCCDPKDDAKSTEDVRDSADPKKDEKTRVEDKPKS